MPADNAQSDYESHRLLRVLAERLNQHGMRTREYRHGHEVVEIAATNPHDPDKGGHVVIGFEGYLVWEYWTEFRTPARVAVDSARAGPRFVTMPGWKTAALVQALTVAKVT